MAFEEVTVPDDFEEGAEFARFNAIGDRIAGRFLETVETDDSFKPGQKRVNYKFKGRKADGSVGTIIVTPSWHLKKLLAAANLKSGDAVIMTKTGERDIGKENPMPQFSLKVERAGAAKPPAKAAAQPQRQAPKAPPPPKQPPPADEFDFPSDGTDDGDIPI